MARFPFNIGRKAGRGGGSHLAPKGSLGRPQGRGPIRPPAMGNQYPVRVNPSRIPKNRVIVPAPTRIPTSGMVANPVESVSTAGMTSMGRVHGPLGPRGPVHGPLGPRGPVHGPGHPRGKSFNDALERRMGGSSGPRGVGTSPTARRAAGPRVRPPRQRNPALNRARAAGMGSTSRPNTPLFRQRHRPPRPKRQPLSRTAPPGKTPRELGDNSRDTARRVMKHKKGLAIGAAAVGGVGYYSNRSGRGTDKTDYAASRGVYGY